MSTWKTRGVYAPVQLWDPDFSFLTKVSNIHQARYDKGFNQVKSIYNSILNSPLTNEGNIAYRDEMFKRLDETLKKNASLDFSKPENVAHVVGLLDPLTKDKDLAYDMSVTKYHLNQKSIMESYKNSEDPEKRELYSDYAAAGIGLAEKALANANRGDGSIQKVQPQDFVQFEDINKYLNEAAEKAGLEIKVDRADPSGYMITEKNGQKAIMPFTAWAQQQMGNRFDRQLRLQSKVMNETEIDNLMQTSGISRQEAVMQIAEERTPKVAQTHQSNVTDLSKSLSAIDKEIAIFDNYYKNGIPANNPGLKERYDDLVEKREIHRKLIANGTNTLKRINDENTNYLVNNLQAETYKDLKDATALGWGSTRAMTDVGFELKPDQVWISKTNNALKWRIHQENKMVEAAKMKQDMIKHRENLQFDYWNAQQDALSAGSKSKTKKGSPQATGQTTLLGEDQIISYLGLNTTGTKFKSEILSQRMQKSYEDMYDAMTQADNGLMQIIVPDQDINLGIRTMNKIKRVADGASGVTFSDDEKQFLNVYGQEIGLGIHPDNITSSDIAKQSLQAIAAATYDKAGETLAYYARTGTVHKKLKNMENFDKTYASLKASIADQDAVDRSVKNIAATINSNKELFEDAKIVGYQPTTNIPIYDLSKLTDEAKNQLDMVIANEFDALTAPVGQMYNIQGLSPGQMEAFLNPNISTMYDEDGNVVDQKTMLDKIGKLPATDQAEIFDDIMRLSYDPIKEVATIEMAVSPSSGVAKASNIQAQSYKVEIPYSSIKANAGVLPEIARGLQSNTASSAGLGPFQPFLSDMFSTVKSSYPMDKAGFSYEIQGVNYSDGYGLNIHTKHWDYVKNEFIEANTKVPISDPSNPKTWIDINDAVNQEFVKYLTREGYMNSVANELEKILLKN